MSMIAEILSAGFLGKPLWIWIAFIGAVVALMALDLGVLHRKNKAIEVRESLLMSAMYIAIGLLFSVAVWFIYFHQTTPSGFDPQLALDDPGARAWTAVQLYVTGFLVEKTLALDNIFVISLVFTYLAIPREYQHRVLFWGIIGVIVLRGLMIGVGATLVSQFSWILYIFAAFLVFTGLMMLRKGDEDHNIAENRILRFLRSRMRVTDTLHGSKFRVRLPDPNSGRMRWFATPLLLALVFVEIVDVVFAIDSVPAIFAITTDPYIVYTSNIFAILGLRALYFALAALIHRFQYLKYALAATLVFIGSKIFLGDLFPSGKFPSEWSLTITLALIGSGIAFSLWKTRGGAGADRAERSIAE